MSELSQMAISARISAGATGVVLPRPLMATEVTLLRYVGFSSKKRAKRVEAWEEAAWVKWRIKSMTDPSWDSESTRIDEIMEKKIF
jgi:hypothetical protein